MRYYVVADVHSVYTELKMALQKQGFFEDTQPHKPIICGDLFDRGQEAVQMQSFVLALMERDEVILTRGNHEDLMLDFLHSLPWANHIPSHHYSNGTVDTVYQLMDTTKELLFICRDSIGKKMLNGPLVQKIIPAMVDYFETDHYIFAHGWIPCEVLPRFRRASEYFFTESWRNASPEEWNKARWTNDMEAAHYGMTDLEKTIVCGHWHSSFGHANYEGTCGEFGGDADFSPYYAPGIIAIDACTAFSRKVNCIVIED